MGEIKTGELVYIKAVVSKPPEDDRTLYRVVTEQEGTVVWATADEIERRPVK